MINFLKIFFPALMVTGALGSLILNIITNKAEWPVSLQWFGAGRYYIQHYYLEINSKGG